MHEVDYFDWLQSEARILIPALWFLSGVIRATPKVPAWLIPYIVITVSIGFTHFLLPDITHVEHFIQGLIISAIVLTGNSVAKRLIAPTIVSKNGGEGNS